MHKSRMVGPHHVILVSADMVVFVEMVQMPVLVVANWDIRQ